MNNPERDPTIARSNQEQDAALLKQRIAEPRRARRQEAVESFTDRGSRMRLVDTAHTSRSWRIHEIAHDFKLEDVWPLPTPGGPDDFSQLVRQMSSGGSCEPLAIRDPAARAMVLRGVHRHQPNARGREYLIV